MKVGIAKSLPVAAALPDKLRKRERAAMATAFAMAFDSNAFSIAFDVKPKVVRTIIYFQRPSRPAQEMERALAERLVSFTVRGIHGRSEPTRRSSNLRVHARSQPCRIHPHVRLPSPRSACHCSPHALGEFGID